MNVNGIMFKLSVKNEHSTIYICENKYSRKCKAIYKISTAGDVNITAHSSACKLANKKDKNFDRKSCMSDATTTMSIKSSLDESLAGIYIPFTPEHSSICKEELSSVFPDETQDVDMEFKSPLPRAKTEGNRKKTEIFKIEDKPVLQFLPAVEKKFCRYCKVKIAGRIRLRKHQQKCPLIDLCRDPLRNRVTSARLRPGRVECDKCLQRFWGKVGSHRCEHTSRHRLCIWCDKYKKCPNKHKNKCRYRRIYLAKKFLVINYHERDREIFQKRHLDYIFTKKEDRHDRPRPTEWTPELRKIAAFYQTEEIEVAQRHYQEWKSEEWTPELRRMAHVYQTYDIRVARKHFQKWQLPYQVPGFCYFSYEGPMILNPSPIQPYHLKIRPNEKEREALAGMISIDDYFRQMIESSPSYKMLCERSGKKILNDWEKQDIFLRCALWHPYIDRMGGPTCWFIKKDPWDKEPTSVFKLRRDPDLEHLRKPVLLAEPGIQTMEEQEGETMEEQEGEVSSVMFLRRMIMRPLTRKVNQKHTENLPELPEEAPQEVKKLEEKKIVSNENVDEDDEILVMATPKREEPKEEEETVSIDEEEEEEREFVFSEFKREDKEERKKVMKIYRQCFLNFNKKMERWVDNQETWCMYRYKELVGCCTFKVLSRKKKEFINVLLFCVDQNYQGKGIGRKMIEEIKRKCPLIVLWSDKDASGFYRRNGFDFAKPLSQDPKDFDLIEYEDMSDLMIHFEREKDMEALGLVEDKKRWQEYFYSFDIRNKK